MATSPAYYSHISSVTKEIDFWPFQPLMFLKTGIGLLVWIRTFQIPSKKSRLPPSMTIEAARKNVEDLESAKLFLESMGTMQRTKRFNLFSANSFVLLILVVFCLAIVNYSVVYWSLYVQNSHLFISNVGSSHLDYHDFAIVSLNNLPIGGTANLRGTTLAVECLLFSERLVAVVLLVVAVFAYSVVSNEQIESDKESLASLIESRLREIQEKLELQEQHIQTISAKTEPKANGGGSS